MKSGKSYLQHKKKREAFVTDNNLKSPLDLTSGIIRQARIVLGYSEKTVAIDIRKGLLDDIRKLNNRK